VASTGWVLYAIAFGPSQTRQALPVDPHWLIGAGLLLALGSGVLPLIGGWPLLTASWSVAEVPGLGTVHLGTPLVFDLGVYVLVIGAVLTIILAMAEE
jgi:multicomponent Na+:H+ antiporter subunit B